MTSPGTIPATREKEGWVVVQVKPSKGVATEADKLIQQRYKNSSAPFSPDGWSPTIGGLTATTGVITAGALGRDFFQGRSQVSGPQLIAPLSTTNKLLPDSFQIEVGAHKQIQIPQSVATSSTRIFPTAKGGLKNILTANNPVKNFKNPLTQGNRLRTLGRFALIASAGTCAWSLYNDLTHANDLDRKILVAFDNDTKKLNSTLVADNSGSGDYKALNFSFRINPSGKIELGQSASQSEASTEKEATNLAIIDSEKEYKPDNAVEALNDIVTLARQDQDEEALKALKDFLVQVNADNYSDPEKQLIKDMRSKLGLEPASGASVPSHSTSAGPSSTSTSNPPKVDLNFIDDLKAGQVKDALIQAREEGYLNKLEQFKEKYQKVKYLKDMAKAINPNLTETDLNDITLP